MTRSPLITIALQSHHNTEAFDCGTDVINKWFAQRALGNQQRFTQTFIAVEHDEIVGFYSLAAGQVRRESAPSQLRRNAPNEIPIFLLARLAVSATNQGRGIGSDLLRDAVIRCIASSREVAASAIKVQATDERAAQFYLQNGFQRINADSLDLYLKIPHIK